MKGEITFCQVLSIKIYATAQVCTFAFPHHSQKHGTKEQQEQNSVQSPTTRANPTPTKITPNPLQNKCQNNQKNENIRQQSCYNDDPTLTQRSTKVTTPTTYNLLNLPPAIALRIDVDTGGHWIWSGSYHPDGLPLIGSKMAHSTIYKHLTPNLPKTAGRIFRTCGVRSCVNPAHMRCPTMENGGLSGRVQKVQSVETDTPNNSDLVKVLQRIAEVLERMEENFAGATHLKT